MREPWLPAPLACHILLERKRSVLLCPTWAWNILKKASDWPILHQVLFCDPITVVRQWLDLIGQDSASAHCQISHCSQGDAILSGWQTSSGTCFRSERDGEEEEVSHRTLPWGEVWPKQIPQCVFAGSNGHGSRKISTQCNDSSKQWSNLTFSRKMQSPRASLGRTPNRVSVFLERWGMVTEDFTLIMTLKGISRRRRAGQVKWGVGKMCKTLVWELLRGL